MAKKQFKSESKRLLDLMINSIYTHKEIFLREIISNASDAIDKLCFISLTDDKVGLDRGDFKIVLKPDKESRTLTITDNGIGMNKDDLENNLGTIASSGSLKFKQSMEEKQDDIDIIGQFGVGFYSAFMVAKKITVNTKKYGEDTAYCWQSSGADGYTISEIEKENAGTEIILEIKDNTDDENYDEFLEQYRIQGLVKKYSDYIRYPIVMDMTKSRVKEETKDSDKPEYETYTEVETLNSMVPIWNRNKKDVTDEEYNNFYKEKFFDFEDPLAYTHAKVEGKQEYTQLLYVPQKAPFDLWDRNARHGIKLYVRRVFIMDDAEKLMPLYLRFVRGVVDSNDLPLNVSREILQESKDIDTLRAGCTKKVLGLLEDLAENQEDKYVTFWKEFGKVLKEGVGEDHANKEKIAGLLRFASTHADTAEETVSLADYIGRMKEGQDKIYFVTADSFNAAKNSPHLEIFRKKGIEVLLLSDRVDEWVVGNLTEFDGKQLASVAKGGLDLGKLEDEAEKAAVEKETGELKDLLDKMKTTLGDKVKEVRVTHRLTDSPACLVADEHDMGMNLARLMKAAGQSMPISKPILEINPAHPVVLRLKYEDKQFDDWAAVLFDQALLAEGGTLDDPASFVKRINQLMLAMNGN